MMNWKNIYKDHLTGDVIERDATPEEMIPFEQGSEMSAVDETEAE